MSVLYFISCVFLMNLLLARCTWASSMSPSTVCSRAALDICLAELTPLLDSPLVKGFPQTPEAVSVACRAFKGGMGCIDRYKENCLSPERQELLEKRVSGARHVMKFLCEDQAFQSDFLQHQQCFRVTAKDWEHCSSHFQKLVAEELQQNISRADQNLGLCCNWKVKI